MKADSLLTQVERLFDLLDSRKTDFVLAGGIALLTSVEGRNTRDIDLIMALPSLAKLPEIEIESQDRYFARGKFGELQIDVLSRRIHCSKKWQSHTVPKDSFWIAPSAVRR